MNVAHLISSEEEISHIIKSKSSKGEVLNASHFALYIVFNFNEQLVSSSGGSNCIEVERPTQISTNKGVKGSQKENNFDFTILLIKSSLMSISIQISDHYCFVIRCTCNHFF